VVQLHLSGRLRTRDARPLRSHLDTLVRLAGAGRPRAVIDLSGVLDLSPSCVRSLREVEQRLTASGCDVDIAGRRGRIRARTGEHPNLRLAAYEGAKGSSG
jgi:hypothetical protein